MAQQERDRLSSELEHERVRSSNDRDQELERQGKTSRHNQGYDEAVRGNASDSGSVTDIDDIVTEE